MADDAHEAKTVRYEREGTVGSIVLARPKQLNAINDVWLADMSTAVNAAALDAELRVLVFRGEGRAFCAGADLKEPPSPSRDAYLQTRMQPMQDLARAIRRLEVPVLAAIQGYAVGGGLELALLADIRVAAHDARFGFPEVTVGATVTMGGLHGLAHVIGLGRAFELLFTGELVDAARAHEIGLVNRVVPVDELPAAASDLARQIAQHYPLELGLTRTALLDSLDAGFDQALDIEAAAGVASFLGGARRQGMARRLRDS